MLALTPWPTHKQIWNEPGGLVGEPIFVPAPGAAAGEQECGQSRLAALPFLRYHRAAGLLGPTLLPIPVCPAEDEGCVLVVVVEAGGASSLVCLDGATMQEQGRARLPWHITIGFHGCFVPAA